ncbi:hypothetical protein SAMN04490203_4532 [Pseudomonas taetrolens]|uniref:Transposase n=1 Tax=Pseudomonas taetrolens TaxID=47884 RepID=A0A1H5CYV1_PSETA|nr:hypothetical protein SAMN04490203_4532 [Pseudomonas taetrolens]
MYELSLVRTLKVLSCEHNLARTHYWKYAAHCWCACAHLGSDRPG